MKRYSPRKPAHHARVPAFVPVATRARKDGWTARRQAGFLAALAITGSVSEAARRVSMARESAYRLRRREGAESFAAAWDAILGRVDGAPRKVTHEERVRRALEGVLKPVIWRGRHVANQRKPDNSALLRYLAQLDRGQGGGRERSQGLVGCAAVPPKILPELARGGGSRPFCRLTEGQWRNPSTTRFAGGPPPRDELGEDQVTGTPPDKPDRTRTGAPFPACRAAGRSGGIRR